MHLQLLNELHNISENLNNISIILNKPQPFWNTQWFAAALGALAALLVTSVNNIFVNRRKRLKSFYDMMATSGHWLSIGSLVAESSITMYGHSLIKNGKTTIITEKEINEKTIIKLRQKCKYWELPYSRIRFLFSKYEKAINFLPNLAKEELSSSKEYKKAEEVFKKITDLVEKKTGENQWTAR